MQNNVKKELFLFIRQLTKVALLNINYIFKEYNTNRQLDFKNDVSPMQNCQYQYALIHQFLVNNVKKGTFSPTHKSSTFEYQLYIMKMRYKLAVGL